MRETMHTNEAALAESYIGAVKARCAANKMTVTLWLLFDTVAGRDPLRRDRALSAFKSYTRANNLPRSVAEGAKWLAHNWEAA